jgi:hypothetical protein
MTFKRGFVIRNQLGQYLDKHSGWQSGKDSNALFRADFHDQALNTLIEVNAKDISLRGKIIEVDLDEKKRPVVEVCEAALALDKRAVNEQESLIEEEAVEEEPVDDESDTEADIEINLTDDSQ